MPEKGHFIVVEGLEGAGKSTALSTIRKFLTPLVPELISTREPGGTKVGEAARSLIKDINENEPLSLKAELLLFYAARAQLLEQVITPALSRGSWVLADRFELSTFAYQGGGREMDESIIQQLSQFCLGNFQADLIIFLDISPELGLERAYKRGKIDRIEQESLEFFTRVYQSYHKHIENMQNVVQIDASMPLMVVQNHIKKILTQYISKVSS